MIFIIHMNNEMCKWAYPHKNSPKTVTFINLISGKLRDDEGNSLIPRKSEWALIFQPIDDDLVAITIGRCRSDRDRSRQSSIVSWTAGISLCDYKKLGADPFTIASLIFHPQVTKEYANFQETTVDEIISKQNGPDIPLTLPDDEQFNSLNIEKKTLELFLTQLICNPDIKVVLKRKQSNADFFHYANKSFDDTEKLLQIIYLCLPVSVRCKISFNTNYIGEGENNPFTIALSSNVTAAQSKSIENSLLEMYSEYQAVLDEYVKPLFDAIQSSDYERASELIRSFTPPDKPIPIPPDPDPPNNDKSNQKIHYIVFFIVFTVIIIIALRFCPSGTSIRTIQTASATQTVTPTITPATPVSGSSFNKKPSDGYFIKGYNKIKSLIDELKKISNQNDAILNKKKNEINITLESIKTLNSDSDKIQSDCQKFESCIDNKANCCDCLKGFLNFEISVQKYNQVCPSPTATATISPTTTPTNTPSLPKPNFTQTPIDDNNGSNIAYKTPTPDEVHPIATNGDKPERESKCKEFITLKINYLESEIARNSNKTKELNSKIKTLEIEVTQLKLKRKRYKVLNDFANKIIDSLMSNAEKSYKSEATFNEFSKEKNSIIRTYNDNDTKKWLEDLWKKYECLHNYAQL